MPSLSLADYCGLQWHPFSCSLDAPGALHLFTFLAPYLGDSIICESLPSTNMHQGALIVLIGFN